MDQLVTLRDKIVSKLLGEPFSEETPNHLPPFIIRRLQKKKVLVVLDNVSTSDQLTTLVGTKEDNWFCPGSKVIITSRDTRVFGLEDMTFYKVEKLNPNYSLRLFCLNAFKRNQPPKGYAELSQQVLNYANGVPLALKVLGSLLYKRKLDEWESILAKLQRSLNKEIKQVLKISYNDLDRTEKTIFLDIACFFEGEDKDRVEDILEGCGLFASTGINRLVEKCMVTLTADNTLGMHDLLQQMGREIAGQKRSRFWTPDDCYNLLTRGHQDAKTIEGIFLNIDAIKRLDLNRKAFSNMESLRLLKLEQSPFSFEGFHEPKVKIRGGVQFFPDSLRFLHWDGFPCESLPSNFYAKNVVELHLHNSELKKLWDGDKHSAILRRLKVLNLQGSESLIELPDLTSATNLEEIILDECPSLLDIPESIQHAHRLSYLSLRMCAELSSIPSLVNSKRLRKLDLCGCSSLERLPESPSDIEELNFEGTAVVKWPGSMSSLNNLKALHVNSDLQTLPRTMHMDSLKQLTLGGCSKLESFPEIIGDIQRLNLENTGIRRLPSSIIFLGSLVELNLQSCTKLERLPDNIGQLKSLKKLTLSFCKKLFDRPFTLSGLCSINELSLQGCELTEFPQWLSTLSSLKKLNLSENCFCRIPESIRRLSEMEILCLNNCNNLQSLPKLPRQVNELVAYGCQSLKVASSLFIADVEPRKQRADYFNSSSYRFCFNDCRGLGSGARKDIVSNAQIRIQQMANSQNEGLRCPLRVSIPGSEFPDCFYQREGSSIIIKLPSNWCKSKFMGFVFGFVAYTVSGEYNITLVPRGKSIKYECKFKNKDDRSIDQYSASFNFNDWGDSGLNPNTLVIQYSGDIYSSKRGNQHCRENHKDATHAEFHFVAKNFEVSKCGVYLVYAQL